MLCFNADHFGFLVKLIILLNTYLSLCHDCPPNNSTDTLHFLRNMSKSIAGDFHKHQNIDCCVTGFTTIEWQFKPPGSTIWSKQIPGNYELIDSNRTLSFKSLEIINNGTYKCKSSDGRGNTIEGNTILEVGCTPDDSDLKLTYKTIQTSFAEHENGRLCCNLSTLNGWDVIITYWKSSINSNIWNNKFWIKDSFKNVSNGRFSIFMKSSFIKKNCDEIISAETCLTINDIQKTDIGYYECIFRRFQDMATNNFTLDIITNKSYIILYSSISALVAVLILIISIIIWIFYYDLIIFHTKVCYSNSKSYKFDTIIIYDDKDTDSVSTAMKISEHLSNKGFSTFIYDRDKKYGTEFHEEYLSSMKASNEILFILSEKSFENESFLFCLNSSTQYKERRIFIFLFSKKLTLKCLKEYPKTNEHLQLIKSSRNYKIWKASYAKDSFMRKRLFKWIISGLSYNAIKRARNEDSPLS